MENFILLKLTFFEEKPLLTFLPVIYIIRHLHNLFAKSYKDIKQIPVQSARIKMNK